MAVECGSNSGKVRLKVRADAVMGAVYTVIDKNSKRVRYSCDIALVYNYYDNEKRKMIQQYIRYNKPQNNFTWEYRGEDHYQLDNKIAWLKKNKLWNELRDCYLYNKDHNNDKNKHSRSIFAESINDVCNEYGYNR